LALSEVSKNIIEVLGVEYDPSIYADIERGYTTITNPINSGDNRSILPPSNLVVYPVTGYDTTNNLFAYFMALQWNPSPSSNVAGYKISGQFFGGSTTLLSTVAGTTYVSTNSQTGLQTFWVGAVTANGTESTFITSGYTIPNANPLGAPPPASGLRISSNNDPYMNVTGFVGIQPQFSWGLPSGSNGLPPVSASFLSYYTLDFTDLNNKRLYQVSIDKNSPSYQLNINDLFNFTGGAPRVFKVNVVSVDTYNNILTGNILNVTNHIPYPPTNSGFSVATDGLTYNISNDPRDTDLSGIYIWYSTGSITPTMTNVSYYSPSLSSKAITGLGTTTGLNVYFSLIDSFGSTGCTIWGPVSTSPIGATSIGAPVLINYFISSQQTGMRAAEAIVDKTMTITGFFAATQSNTASLISGTFYSITLDNQNKTTIFNFGVPANGSCQTGSLTPTVINKFSKVGFDINTYSSTGAAGLVVAIVGYE
jgi:hypothetical protein